MARQRFRTLSKRLWHLKSVRSGAVILGVVALIVGGLVASYHWRHGGTPYVYGVSFSQKYAEELGLDWQAAYLALLEDLEFKQLRLMSYWDRHEPQPGRYDFGDLDWQLKQAEEYGARVSLAIGLRQPRWPECHPPKWTQALPKAERDQALLTYTKTVIERYRDQPVLASWQLENEAANRHFGLCGEPDFEMLKRQHDLLKELDPDRTLIINVSNQSGFPIREPKGDKVGFSVYKRAYFRLLGRDWRWSYWYLPSWWHTLRAELLELDGRDTFIHELQAEPWGPKATVRLSLEEQAESMDPKKLRQNVAFAQRSGIRDIYLWGGEWWYWRLSEFDDPSLWETVRSILSD